MASNNTASIAQARKLVEQLKMEANIDRIKVSMASHTGSAGLVRSITCSQVSFDYSSMESNETNDGGRGLPWWLSGKESACQCRRHQFDPWSGKIPHATEQLSPCATTTALQNPGAITTEPTCFSLLKPMCPRACAL